MKYIALFLILLKILVFLFTTLRVISKSSLLQKDSYVNKIHNNPFYPIYFQFPIFNSYFMKDNNEDGVKFQKYKYTEPIIYFSLVQVFIESNLTRR